MENKYGLMIIYYNYKGIKWEQHRIYFMIYLIDTKNIGKLRD